MDDEAPENQPPMPEPRRVDQRRLRYSRRWFIGLVASALAAAVAALKLVPRGHAAPGVRSTIGGRLKGVLSDWPVNTADRVPSLAANQWVVTVDGLVEQPLAIDHSAWLALKRVDEKVNFHCVEGWTVDNVVWGGVHLATILAGAKPKAEGRFITFHAAGGIYSDSLTMAEALQPQTMLVDTLDGQPLPREHGGPLRLVVPDQMGYKSVKWVQRLEVTSTQAIGYWERQGYPVEAPV